MESDDSYTELKKKKKSASAAKPPYKIKNALKVPRATTYTAQALYGMQCPLFFFWRVL